MTGRAVPPVPTEAELAESAKYLAAFCRLWAKTPTGQVLGGAISELVPHIETVPAALDGRGADVGTVGSWPTTTKGRVS